MFKIAFTGAAAVALVTASVASAQQQTTPTKMDLKVSATSTTGKGSKKKPLPVSAGFKLTTSTPDGTRQESWKRIDNAWYGVRSNGRYFPKCTVNEIASKQSDADCPKKSLVAKGKLVALNGPASIFNFPGARCEKDVSIYNAGQGKVAALLEGPGSACAGVGYLPPFPGTWSRTGGIGGGERLRIPIPNNISHPLPGILGSPVTLNITMKKMTRRVKGKTRGYIESINCKGSRREWRQTIIGDPSGTAYRTKSRAGKCRR